ncbi:glycosyltransferase family 9 protein [uncultured Amnibacterium sp.]|uniref:glycosyltransferase family 9 protein n=1 Tax=uncultured Amnibacterium sp. TaxID=1631851 RepID=UPI0035CC45B6
MADRPRRVLVARMDSMGDVLMAGPAIRAVAARPDTEVWLLAGPRGEAAARLLPGVAQVRVIGTPWITAVDRPVDRLLVDEVEALVTECDPDEVIVLTAFHQSPLPIALLLKLAGVQRITGASVQASAGLLDIRLLPGDDFPEDIPEPERNLRIVAAAGYTLPDGDDGALAVIAIDDPPAVLASLPPRYLVVHPGAQVPAREYPAQQHAAAVEQLTALGHPVVVTGGRHERDLTALVAGTTGIDLGGRLDLRGMVAVIGGARVMVVGNTGPAHLAAAVGVPIVGLFSAVVPAVRWAPYGVPTVLLGDQHAACRGTRAQLCPVPGHPCLTGVPPEAVVAAAQRLLAETA